MAPMIRARRMSCSPNDEVGSVQFRPYPSPARDVETCTLRWRSDGPAPRLAPRGHGLRPVGGLPPLLAAPGAGRRPRDPCAPGPVVAGHDGAAGARAATKSTVPGTVLAPADLPAAGRGGVH